jgi:pimeloyl-ACP methyl ester carboxylesterase
MSTRRQRSILAGAAGVGALSVTGVIAQRQHMKRVASDPERDVLENPPAGEPTSVRSADGTTLHVESFGPSDGPTVVLVHGWTELLTFWIYVIRELTAAGMRVVAYDLRGHGHSEPAAAGEYKLARFGEDLESVLTACVPDGQRAVVAGHSLGAMSIAAWAEDHEVGRQVSAAALVNTGVGNLIAEQLLIPVPPIARAVSQTVAVRGFLGARAPLPHYSTPLSSAMIRYTAFSRQASPALVAFYERMLWTCPPRVRADIGIAMSEMDLFDALTRLTVPTSVIAGADDRLTPPSHARRIAEMLPDLRELVVLPDTAHMAPLERPHEVSRAVLGLVSRELAPPVADGSLSAVASDGRS